MAWMVRSGGLLGDRPGVAGSWTHGQLQHISTRRSQTARYREAAEIPSFGET